MSRGQSPSFNDDDLPLPSLPPRQPPAGAPAPPEPPPTRSPSPQPGYPVSQPRVVPQKKSSNGCAIGATIGILLIVGILLFIQLPQWLRFNTWAPGSALDVNPSGTRATTLVTSPPPAPFLHASSEVAPSSVDLSAEGKLDWVDWGYLESDNAYSDQFIGHPVWMDCQGTNGDCLNRKQGANQLIGDYAPVGNFDTSRLPFRLYVRDALTSFSWNDGTPIYTAARARTQEYMAGVGNGFEIEIPANQTTHTFRLYLGIWNAQVQFTASLSDGSAPEYTDSSLPPGSPQYVYTITYRAASSQQTLKISLEILVDYGGANTSLSAATLQ